MLYFRSASLNKKFVVLMLVLCFMGTFLMNDAHADGPIGVKVFGGSAIDQFDNISATQDSGFIAVGRIDSVRIAKLGADGSTRWDASPSALLFYSVTEIQDGNYIAVDQSISSGGEISGIFKGGASDAVVAKYDFQR